MDHADDLFADSVNSPNPTWDVMLKRGLRKRCPRCGSGEIFSSWFRMKERCPTCGFKFEREEGFFIGVYFINFAITEGVLFIVMIALIVMLDRNAHTSYVPPLVAGLVLAVVVPAACYPFARTIWSAIDLSMTPLELDEIVAARDHLHQLEQAPDPD